MDKISGASLASSTFSNDPQGPTEHCFLGELNYWRRKARTCSLTNSSVRTSASSMFERALGTRWISLGNVNGVVGVRKRLSGRRRKAEAGGRRLNSRQDISHGRGQQQIGRSSWKERPKGKINPTRQIQNVELRSRDCLGLRLLGVFFRLLQERNEEEGE